MMSPGFPCCLTLLFVAFAGWVVTPAWSQIVADPSVNSIVTSEGKTFEIKGGTTAGTNLFHSFQEFSIPTGTEAFFNNPLSIENIITRITGQKISHINGLLRANGTANLFLLNPNGIIFGPNAQLNIGGSFIGTTAESILFENGTAFSAGTPETSPLLTISVPIGLQFGSNVKPIQVQGTGHSLTLKSTPENFFPPFTRNLNPQGLTVQPGKTLALIGGNLVLEGGQLLAAKGRVELGSVSGGQVSLTSTESGFAFNYDQVPAFQDIQLSQKSAIDASGANGGGIHLSGRRISLTDGSVTLIQNADNQSAGDTTVFAAQSLELFGTTPDGLVRSSLVHETLGLGSSGNLQIFAPQVVLKDGGQLITRTFSTGPAGNITLNAPDFITVLNASPLNPLFFSSIFTLNSGGASGQAGNLNISTGKLSILGGGIVTSSAFGMGSGGNLILKASEAVEVAGQDPVYQSPSDLNVATFRSGNAGSMTIETQRLIVRNQATVRASTVGRGNAGSITINASEGVELSRGGSIESAVNLNSFVEEVVGIRAAASGKAGGISLNTNRLVIQDGAKVTVENIGSANGGTLQIKAGSIFLTRQGLLNASTASGEGGNIVLQAAQLVMRQGSVIATNANGNGNGGNITLNIPVMAGLENSDIAANALKGAGGNIEITSQGIFGLEFRPLSTPNSDITASSQFGVSGNVSIRKPNVQPDAALVNLPDNLIDPNQAMVQGCEFASENHFSVTGRGGLPPNPTQRLEPEEHPWADLRDLSVFRRVHQPIAFSLIPPQLVEANAWQLNQQGQVEIYVKVPETPHFFEATCAISHKS